MSWLVSEASEAVAHGERSGTLPAAIGIVVVVTALVLLVQGELLRAAARARDARPLEPVHFAVAPLLAALAAIVLVRLLDLL